MRNTNENRKGKERKGKRRRAHSPSRADNRAFPVLVPVSVLVRFRSVPGPVSVLVRFWFGPGQVGFLSPFRSLSVPCPDPVSFPVPDWFPFRSRSLYIQVPVPSCIFPYNGFGLVPFRFGSFPVLVWFPFPVSVRIGYGPRRKPQQQPKRRDGVKGVPFRAGTAGGGTGGGPVRFVNSSDM
jgi:hypothetical protein